MVQLSARLGRGGRRELLAVVVAVLAVCVVGTAVAAAATPQDDLKGPNALVQKALVAARAGDLAGSRAAYDEYENAWFDVEQAVQASSRQTYIDIEKAMTGVATALAATPADGSRVVDALLALDREQVAFIGSGQAPSATTTAGQPVTAATANGGQATLSGVIAVLTETQTALGRGDYASATTRLKSFEASWPDVEGQVKTRSADDYRQTETDMALAESLAAQQSPQAAEVVDRMVGRLQPYTEAQRYNVFDATIILLREGLEALLVIVALTTFLKKSGNRAGQGWVWSGAVGGLVLSVVLGLAIQAFFGAIINPGNREIMEGSIGLVAAAMLVYVSYWLHSKASIGGWQRYIRDHSQEALGGGRMIGLGVLAFLAVFREGAETSLFYLGMVNGISNTDLFIGLGLGALALAALGVLMVGAGLRIPMRPFFTVASILVFYLCFKFVGMGMHALQVAGVLPSGSAAYLPSLDAIGLYPTWLTTIAQLILLLAAVGIVLRERFDRRDNGRRGKRQPPQRVLASSSR